MAHLILSADKWKFPRKINRLDFEPGHGFLRKYDKVMDSFLINKCTYTEFCTYTAWLKHNPLQSNPYTARHCWCPHICHCIWRMCLCIWLSPVCPTPRWGLSLIWVLSLGCSVNICWVNWFLEFQLLEAQFVIKDKYLRTNSKSGHRFLNKS